MKQDALDCIQAIASSDPIKFKGAGLLKESGIFDADIASKPLWVQEAYHQLRGLVSDEEFYSLRNSGLFNSHYTKPEIIAEMWSIVRDRVSEDKLRVLDPGCGNANFWLHCPNRVGVVYTGVERCPVAARLAKVVTANYGGAIASRDFIEFCQVNAWRKWDVVIGNVPFVDGVRVEGLGLHYRFIEAGIKVLRPGGVMCILTTSSTLDSCGVDAVACRSRIDEVAKFLAAFRLPGRLVHFGNTEVTTDLLLLEKR